MKMEFIKQPKFARLCLQIGLAFIFLYAALSATLRPNDWIGYLPAYLDSFLPREILLKIFSLLELVLAIWLLSSFKLFWAAVTATLVLVGITFTNLTIFDVTFRDVGLIFAALALVSLSLRD